MALRPPVVAVVAALLSSPVLAGPASETRVSYTVSYLGLTVARANLALKLQDGRYSVGLGYKTTGLVKVVSDAKGEAEAGGTVAAGRLMTSVYALKSDEGGDSKDVLVESDGGVVRNSRAVPPLRAVEKRVPILPEHRRNTLDPISGALFPVVAADPLSGDNCARTAPVFDGWTRYDIVFSYKKTVPVKAKGYSGDGLVCAARWVPVAGHRPDTPATKFMTDNKNLEVTLVPTASGLLVPAQISIATLSGTIVISAERIAGAGD